VLSEEIYNAAASSNVEVVDEYDVAQAEKEDAGLLPGMFPDRAGSTQLWTKTAADVVKPIAISTNYIMAAPFNIVRPVPNTYVGFQVGTQGNHAKVFLGNLSRKAFAPLGSIRELALTKSTENLYDYNKFVNVDGMWGIIIKVTEDNSFLCYVPSLDEIVEVDGGDVYDFS
jgi:hypothetical protein